jgi:hypothetical protein
MYEEHLYRKKMYEEHWSIAEGDPADSFPIEQADVILWIISENKVTSWIRYHANSYVFVLNFVTPLLKYQLT